jgi:phosphoribosylformimino-5-aminoimidazole carboxamide ribotide isomerase
LPSLADPRAPRIAISEPPPSALYVHNTKMTRFRPCIDLHAGSVKQIVGGTLSTTTPDVLKTNWTSEHPSAYYASLYKQHALAGAHVIMLGPGNDNAAKEALEAWKDGMQVGGGITEKNAKEWIDRGAERVSSILVEVRTQHEI